MIGADNDAEHYWLIVWITAGENEGNRYVLNGGDRLTVRDRQCFRVQGHSLINELACWRVEHKELVIVARHSLDSRGYGEVVDALTSPTIEDLPRAKCEVALGRDGVNIFGERRQEICQTTRRDQLPLDENTIFTPGKEDWCIERFSCELSATVQDIQ